MRLRVGILDRGTDFRDVGLFIDQVMRDAHGVEDRLDDAHAIARRIAWRSRGIVPEQPDHHADGLAILDRDATDGVDGVEKARVLDECQGALVAYESPDAMPMHSSSLQTRMSLNAGSREMGRSKPPLVTISGTERMNSTPLALIAAMMDEPLSSIVSSPAVSKSASMRDLRPTPMRENIGAGT